MALGPGFRTVCWELHRVPEAIYRCCLPGASLTDRAGGFGYERIRVKLRMPGWECGVRSVHRAGGAAPGTPPVRARGPWNGETVMDAVVKPLRKAPLCDAPLSDHVKAAATPAVARPSREEAEA